MFLAERFYNYLRLSMIRTGSKERYLKFVHAGTETVD